MFRFFSFEDHSYRHLLRCCIFLIGLGFFEEVLAALDSDLDLVDCLVCEKVSSPWISFFFERNLNTLEDFSASFGSFDFSGHVYSVELPGGTVDLPHRVSPEDFFLFQGANACCAPGVRWLCSHDACSQLRDRRRVREDACDPLEASHDPVEDGRR